MCCDHGIILKQAPAQNPEKLNLGVWSSKPSIS
jgi:hypothetical protein